MPGRLVSRETESGAVAEFLTSAADGPAGLVIDGEPGIGKTALWNAALDDARSRGFTVMTASASAAESVFAYASLADMLSDVHQSTIAELPAPQRNAIDQVLLRADRAATDQRAVAAGFLSIVSALTDATSVLIAIDDIQWLDPSSLLVIAFAARRITGPVGLVVTVRTGDIERVTPWPHLGAPDAVRHVSLAPLSVGALHALIAQRLGRSLPRPAIVKIADVSGGNPFYALELARSMTEGAGDADLALPPTLTELVRSKIRTHDEAAADALLATACLATPTVDAVARAVGTDPDGVVRLLQPLEDDGVVQLVGEQLRFRHPIFALGVYREASPVRRRVIHRRLADIVDQPELTARHLALGATQGDPQTFESLDRAAESASVRGAPTAAAELLNLAITLGGDTPQRRIRLARVHFSAGDPDRARRILEGTIDELPRGAPRAEAVSLLGYVRVLHDNFPGAAELLHDALDESGDDPALTVPMLVTLAFALFNLGRLDAAVERADEAVARAERLGESQLLSQALSMRATVGFLRGEGVDESGIARALELEDPDTTVPSALCPSVHSALLHSCSGRLDEAHAEFTALRKRYIDLGQDGDLMFLALHAALTQVWRGEFASAALIVEDAMERAQQLGGDLSMSVALITRALLAAYAGRADDTRRDVEAARAASRRSGSHRLAEWATTALGFVEVSLGNHEAALVALEPLRQRVEALPDVTEIITAAYIPDLVEALIHLDRTDSAEPLVAALERNGRRLGRAWMLAVGARGRAMLHAAQGDLEAGIASAEEAMTHHDRLAMPFERARTELVLGRLQRRHRRKSAAAVTLDSALQTFERLGTPLWADRARAELGHAATRIDAPAVLTPSEQKVAELAAQGMTNRKVAAAMFISPKTVEANLSRIYAKLGIHSRAELGRRMSRRDD